MVFQYLLVFEIDPPTLEFDQACGGQAQYEKNCHEYWFEFKGVRISLAPGPPSRIGSGPLPSAPLCCTACPQPARIL